MKYGIKVDATLSGWVRTHVLAPTEVKYSILELGRYTEFIFYDEIYRDVSHNVIMKKLSDAVAKVERN